MAHITREELLKIARISNLQLDEQEIPVLIKQIEDVLTYAACVQEIVKFGNAEEPLAKNSNVFRPDVVIKTDPETILDRAPERERNYFVVPVILENL